MSNFLCWGWSQTVSRLDRLGRSLAHLIEIIDAIGKTKAGFASLSESIDTEKEEWMRDTLFRAALETEQAKHRSAS